MTRGSRDWRPRVQLMTLAVLGIRPMEAATILNIPYGSAKVILFKCRKVYPVPEFGRGPKPTRTPIPKGKRKWKHTGFVETGLESAMNHARSA